AEDGIRDRNVTGVQTCALPISGGHPVRSNPLASIAHRDSRHRVGPLQPDVHPAAAWRELDGVGQEVPDDLLESIGIGRDRAEVRSEERRVGKEGRAWVGRAYYK